MLIKNKLLILAIVILGYFVFRLETINKHYADSTQITKDEITIDNLEKNINVGEIIKSDLIDLEDLYLSNLDYEVPFSYNENPEFFNDMNDGFFKGFIGAFVEKEYNVELSSKIDLGIDYSSLIIEEDDSNLKLIYNDKLLTDVDLLLTDSVLDKGVGLFRLDFSESDRALLIDSMSNYIKDSVKDDSKLIEDFKERVKTYLTTKSLQVQSAYGLNKNITVEVNFVFEK